MALPLRRADTPAERKERSGSTERQEAQGGWCRARQGEMPTARKKSVTLAEVGEATAIGVAFLRRAMIFPVAILGGDRNATLDESSKCSTAR